MPLMAQVSAKRKAEPGPGLRTSGAEESDSQPPLKSMRSSPSVTTSSSASASSLPSFALQGVRDGVMFVQNSEDISFINSSLLSMLQLPRSAPVLSSSVPLFFKSFFAEEVLSSFLETLQSALLEHQEKERVFSFSFPSSPESPLLLSVSFRPVDSGTACLFFRHERQSITQLLESLAWYALADEVHPFLWSIFEYVPEEDDRIVRAISNHAVEKAGIDYKHVNILAKKEAGANPTVINPILDTARALIAQAQSNQPAYTSFSSSFHCSILPSSPYFAEPYSILRQLPVYMPSLTLLRRGENGAEFGQLCVYLGKNPGTGRHVFFSRYEDHPEQLQPRELERHKRMLVETQKEAELFKHFFDTAPYWAAIVEMNDSFTDCTYVCANTLALEEMGTIQQDLAKERRSVVKGYTAERASWLLEKFKQAYEEKKPVRFNWDMDGTGVESPVCVQHMSDRKFSLTVQDFVQGRDVKQNNKHS